MEDEWISKWTGREYTSYVNGGYTVTGGQLRIVKTLRIINSTSMESVKICRHYFAFLRAFFLSG
jgi:hypothetical protein